MSAAILTVSLWNTVPSWLVVSGGESKGLWLALVGSFTDSLWWSRQTPSPLDGLLTRTLGSHAFRDVYHFPCHLAVDGAAGGIWVRWQTGAFGSQLASSAAGSPEHLRQSCLVLFPKRIFVLLLQK